MSIQYRKAEEGASGLYAYSHREIVRSCGIILILQIGLRIEGNEREPAGLHLDHQPVPGQEIMVDVRHRERHPEFLPVLCRNR